MLNSQPLFKIQLCCLVLLIFLKNGASSMFSGVYRPTLSFQPDDAAGAFLIKQQRFTKTMFYAMNMTAYQTHKHTDESTIEILLRGRCSTCMNLQTRDFLDYFVESLSTTVENLRADQRDAVNHLSKGLRRTILGLKAVSETFSVLDKRQEQTAVVLAFNSDMTRRISTRLKILFFQASFWSVYRYHKNIYVTVKNAADYETVMDMHLPQVQVVNLAISLGEAAQGMKYMSAVSLMHGMLIKQSLEYVATTWHTSEKWTRFKYLYFSVGDQMLHARDFPGLYNTLDVGSEGNFLLAPHRMQTLLVAQSFSPEAQFAMWPDRAENVTSSADAGSRRKGPFHDLSTAQHGRSKAGANANVNANAKPQHRVMNKSPSPQWLPGIQLLTESLAGVQGSCCDQGRILFPDCVKKPAFQFKPEISLFGAENKEEESRSLHGPKHHRPQWAACTDWGARNFSTWMRVGPDGFTMPPVTVHLAQCRYSAERELCALPPRSASTSFDSGTCHRMPLALHLQRPISDVDINTDAAQRRRNHQLEPPPMQDQQQGLYQQQEEDLDGDGDGKVYLHCSELSTVTYDPNTEHLLSRSVQKTLHVKDTSPSR